MNNIIKFFSCTLSKVTVLLIFSLSSHQVSGNPLVDFLKGLLGHPVFEQSPFYSTDDEIVIESHDGVELHGNIFVPSSALSSYPVIIFINSWTLDEYQYLTEAASFAKQGYIVFSYSTRGFGQSGGEVGTAGSEDIKDLSTIIDYLQEHYPIDNTRIGAAGISYGSGIALLGAAFDERITAVAAMSTWGSLKDSLYGQNTPRLFWGGVLTGAGYLRGVPSADVLDNYLNILRHENIDQVTEWSDKRSPLTYIDEINASNAAIYLSNNLSDNLFQVNSVLALYEALTVPKLLTLNQGTHAADEVLGMGYEQHLVWNNVHDWFDYWLKGQLNGVTEKAKFEYKVKFGDYEQLEDWPSTQVNERTLHLHERTFSGRGSMELTPYYSWWPKTDTIYSGLDTLATTGVPLLSYFAEGVLDIPILSYMPLISTINAIRWESDWLYDTMRLRGIPKIQLNVTPSKSSALLVAYLYDVSWSGIGRLITHAPYTILDADAGQPMTIDLAMAATAYDVPVGHQLALVIDTQDLLYGKPRSDLYKVKINYDSSIANLLSLPIQ